MDCKRNTKYNHHMGRDRTKFKSGYLTTIFPKVIYSSNRFSVCTSNETLSRTPGNIKKKIFLMYCSIEDNNNQLYRNFVKHHKHKFQNIEGKHFNTTLLCEEKYIIHQIRGGEHITLQNKIKNFHHTITRLTLRFMQC